jgi:hypothetical protein
MSRGEIFGERPQSPIPLASGIRACSAGEMPEAPQEQRLGRMARWDFCFISSSGKAPQMGIFLSEPFLKQGYESSIG